MSFKPRTGQARFLLQLEESAKVHRRAGSGIFRRGEVAR